MTTIDFVHDFEPYRQRARALTDAMIAGELEALGAVVALFEELDDRFIVPLTAVYDALPVDDRAEDRRMDMDQHDAIWQVVYGFAGVAELGVLRDVAMDWADPADDPSPRQAVLGAAGLRYRDLLAAAK